MNPHHIDQYLSVVTGCLGAEFDYLFQIPDHERDILFSLNFANKQEHIISNVNAAVLPDLRFFSDLLQAFTLEVKTGFDSADGHQIKQRYADRIAAKVDIIQKGADRLARTLRDEWSLPEDPRCSYFFSHQDIELYGQRVQREMHLKGLVNSCGREEEAQIASRNLGAYRRGRREGEAHFYFALLIADWTERFLGGYLALYCSRTDSPIVYNKSSPDDLIILSQPVKEPHELLLLPASDQKGLSNSMSLSSSSLYNTFAGLFYSPIDLKHAIEVLHKVTSDKKFKVIDPSGHWLGKERDGSRSVLLAWVEVLRLQGWFQIGVTNLQMSALLNNYFAGLNLSITDDSLWRKQKVSTVVNSYHADFLQLIKKR